MKRVIFECTGNSLLFILAGIMLIHPFSEFQSSEDEFYFATGVFPAIFILYLIIFGASRLLIYKKSKKSFYKDSELSFSDEREKIIVAESTKLAYQVIITGLIIAMALLALIQFFSMTILQNMQIDIYFASITLFTLILVAAMAAYGIKWCVEYKK